MSRAWSPTWLSPIAPSISACGVSAHEPRLEPHVAVAHRAVDLRLRRQRGDRVDDDDLDRARTDQLLADGERLLARVRLRDDEVVEVDADLARVAGVERVLRVDERGGAARLLDVRDRVQRERRLARGLVAVELDDAPLGEPADPEREVERQRPRRHRRHRAVRLLPKPQDRHLAELLADLAHHRLQRRAHLLQG